MGTSLRDYAEDIAIDGSGNVVMAGVTWGDLMPGHSDPNPNYSDGWVAKYDASGTRIWAVQFGTDTGDEAKSIAVDGSDNVIVAGGSSGDFGGINAGGTDAFVSKYDPRR
ncbi:MAG: hypothetical protein HC834_03240 [Rhodospirillales bacterium]|nr:hypothetical protein [Rhodospirillales bacterium]